MNPILSPWIVYLGQVFDGLSIVCITALAIGAIVTIISVGLYINYAVDDYYGPKSNEYKYSKLFVKIFIPVTIIGLLGTMLIPSKETYYGMIASSYITTDNVTAVTNYGKDVVDYIFEKMQGNEDE